MIGQINLNCAACPSPKAVPPLTYPTTVALLLLVLLLAVAPGSAAAEAVSGQSPPVVINPDMGEVFIGRHSGCCAIPPAG